MAKAVKPEVEPKEPAAPVEVDPNAVVLHLDRDPNDPRLRPAVDGNTLPKVDINVPVE